MSWLNEMTTEFLGEVRQAKDKNVYPFFRPFKNFGPRVRVGSSSYINFTSNDYLGLSQDPRVIERAGEALRRYGTGLGSARMQATSDRHAELEARISAWMGYPSCATFTSGYQAMVGVLATFPDDDTCLVLDKLSHACIVDGSLIALGQHPDMELRYFKHNSAEALRKVLSQTEKPKKFVVVEGLYSVDGDLAPLPDLIRVCKEFGAVICVDDAHGIASLGPAGRGTAELQGVLGQIDLLYGSFSKCFGGIGGFVLGDADVIEYLKHKARSFVYSASLPVPQVEAALAVLDLIENDNTYVRRLARNKDFFRNGLLSLGFNLGDSVTHITPIMVGEDLKTLAYGAYLFHAAGIIMMPFIYPGVPRGKARLRCNVTAAHTEADMGYALESLGVIGKQLGLIPRSAKTRSSFTSKVRWFAESKLNGYRNAGAGIVAQEAKQLGLQAYEGAKSLLGIENPDLASPASGGKDAH